MAEKLPLGMKFLAKMEDQYLLSNGTDVQDLGKRQTLHFPDRAVIEALWEKFCPGVTFEFVTKVCTAPITGFQVKIGHNHKTTREQRQKFCDALIELCTIEAA